MPLPEEVEDTPSVYQRECEPDEYREPREFGYVNVRISHQTMDNIRYPVSEFLPLEGKAKDWPE